MGVPIPGTEHLFFKRHLYRPVCLENKECLGAVLPENF